MTPAGQEAILLAGAPGPAAARLLWRLCESGRTPCAFVTRSFAGWHWKNDRRLAAETPAWSVSAALRHFAVETAVATGAADWPALLDRLQPTLLLSCHYPARIPARVLDALPGRCLNLHPALLPAYRGLLPQMAMALAGEGERYGGVTLHCMNERFDQGHIVDQRAVPLMPGGDMIDWELALARAGAGLALEALPAYLDGTLTTVPQEECRASYVRLAALRRDLDPAMSASEALRIAAIVGQTSDIVLQSARGTPLRLMLPGRRLGGASGAPPRRGLLTVDFDVADARLRFRRRLPGDGRRLSRRRRQRWRRAPP